MQPVSLYLANPHYVQFRGRPVILMASGEHYGAVLNRAFDFHTYLDTLARSGLNLTRTFSGVYREIPGEFNIANNVLAPAQGDFICPWPQAANGKFDLNGFNEAYFARLKDFVRYAGERDVVVEFVFFCFWYNQPLWAYSPMHPENNLQGIGPQDKEGVYRLASNDLIPVQEALVRRIVNELNEFDNLYYEICNEPYSRHDHTDYLDWQNRVAQVIVATETDLPKRHLIARNVQNRTLRVTDLHPAFSIINFHYALPEAVQWNYHLNRVLADDETGFAGQTAAPYRREAWRFLLAGGGIFSHLDYSFTVSHPDGSWSDWAQTPGYGGADLRRQLAYLKHILEAAQAWQLAPHNEVFPWHSGELVAHVLADPGRRYLIYLGQRMSEQILRINLPAGQYALHWLDPIECRTLHTESIEHPGHRAQLAMPAERDEIALEIRRQ